MKLRSTIIVAVAASVAIAIGINIAYGAFCGLPGDPNTPVTAYWSACF